MATTFFQNFKPINFDPNFHWYRRVNWRWVIQRSPILALGIDSSYNVAKFVGLDSTPAIIQIITGITFDLVFVGMIGLADQFRNNKLYSNILFWIINVIAMGVAATLGTLAYSTGTYIHITPESATRGIAFPLLGLLYNLYYHAVTSEIVNDQRKAQEAERKALEEKPFKCEFCSVRFETIKQRNGHLARCQQKRSTA